MGRGANRYAGGGESQNPWHYARVCAKCQGMVHERAKHTHTNDAHRAAPAPTAG
jgi:hypothetical protein